MSDTCDPRKDADWRWYRTEAIVRDDYECQECGVKGGRKGNADLEVHHIEPVKDGGETELDNLVTLCSDCHREEHRASDGQRGMAKSRALLTGTEREQIAGEHGDERRYQATSRVRRRINEELTTDVEVLAEHHPQLLEELREVVCDG